MSHRTPPPGKAPGGDARVATSDGSRAVPAGPRPVDPGSRAARKRVLIIDDDSAARQGLEEFLGAYGFETSVAKDGLEALALLRAGLDIRFVILDLLMPKLSGYEFLKAKRALAPELRDLPVAVLTSVKGAFVGDVVAVFEKPAPLLELLETIEQHVAGGAAGSNSAG